MKSKNNKRIIIKEFKVRMKRRIRWEKMHNRGSRNTLWRLRALQRYKLKRKIRHLLMNWNISGENKSKKWQTKLHLMRKRGVSNKRIRWSKELQFQTFSARAIVVMFLMSSRKLKTQKMKKSLIVWIMRASTIKYLIMAPTTKQSKIRREKRSLERKRKLKRSSRRRKFASWKLSTKLSAGVSKDNKICNKNNSIQ